MELRYQFIYGIELQFRTSATNEGQPHGLIVNVSIKIKNMHLNATVYAIIQCRAVADTQHPRMLFPAKENTPSAGTSFSQSPMRRLAVGKPILRPTR